MTNIIFIDVAKYLAKWEIPTVGHLSEETAYRLIVDKLFDQYSKVLYIDCDTIIRRDVRALFEINIEGYILGAVRGRLIGGIYEYLKNELHISPEGYFNAGILLINIDEFRKQGIGEKALDMLVNGEYLCQDQDVLNILCDGKIKYIDGRWNVEWEHLTSNNINVIIDKTREGTLEYINDPYIIHYTSRIKPWMRPDIKLAECFWEVARKSPFYDEIISRYNEKKKDIEEYHIPYDRFGKNDKCILYGYGRVGKYYYNEILKKQGCKIIAVCDKCADRINDLTVPAIFPNDISNYEYDHILIAVERKKIADEIVMELYKYKVEPEKIIWENPVNVRSDI